MLEMFKFVKEMSKYAPPDAVNWNDQSINQQLFRKGKICMYLGGHWTSMRTSRSARYARTG